MCNNQWCIAINVIWFVNYNVIFAYKPLISNNNSNDANQGELIRETSRHLIKRLSEHANAIRSNNINGSATAAHYTSVDSNVQIEDRNFPVNLLHKCAGFRLLIEKCYKHINCKPLLNKNTGLYLTR